MANIGVKIAGIYMKNPVMPAAGPNVRTGELMLKAVEGGAGAVVSKTVSVVPADDPRPTIRSTICRGAINCETWSEIDVVNFLEELKKAKSTGVPLIVSVGYRADEVEELGKLIQREIAPDAFEFSIHYVGREIQPIVDIAIALRRAVDVPIFMKLSPNIPNIEELAVAASPYVDGFVAINSFGPVLDFDPENPVPKLGSQQGYGWLSGPPILPVALRIVHQVSSVQPKPVIGVGGIEKGTDAIKFFMAGASAVQICTGAIKFGHNIYGKVAEEINDWLDKHGYSSIDEIRGLYAKKLSERKKFAGIPVMTIDEEKCTGCRVCVTKCIQGALYMDGEIAKVIPQNCIGCGFCADFCRYDAMELGERI